MATEINEKLEALKNRFKFNAEKAQADASGGSEENEENFKKAYKLVNGRNNFRPIAFEDGLLVHKAWVHMNLGEPFLCPNKLDKNHECPDCAFGWELYNANGKKHTDDSKNYLAQEKYIIQGIVRAKEQEDIAKYGYPKVRFIDLSPTNGKTIEGYASDDDLKEFGDISDFDTGRDINLKKDDEKAKARQLSVEITRAGKESPILSTLKPSDPKYSEMLFATLDNMIDIRDRFALKSKNQILEMMNNLKQRLAKKANTQTTSPDFEEAVSNLKNSEMDELDDLIHKL